MNQLEDRIVRRIMEEGPVTFETFMDMALYDQDYGYYSSEQTRVGRRGDFYTSSHLHPVFGAMVARQIREMWISMGSPDGFTVVEMGAGEGHVCRDMLEYLSGTGCAEHGAGNCFFDSLQYLIVERNIHQKLRQQDLLKEFSGKVLWLDHIRDAGDMKGCVFSNELLDAFPVHLVRMAGELKEIHVTHDGSSFMLKDGPLSTDEIGRYVDGLPVRLARGYVTEVNLRIRGWLQDIKAVLREGFIFTIDYGYSAEEYYSEDRNMGTLLCYHRHSLSEDPFANIGGQDMTAHVNFSSLKEWGEEMGFWPVGYCGQGSFLISAGIDREIERLAGRIGQKEYLFELSRIKKLFMPQGLGESHRVMVQYKGKGEPKLSGFSLRNQLRQL